MTIDDLARSYTLAVFRSLKYRATWLPNDVLELGAVGYLEQGLFYERQHLGDFGVNFESKTDAAKASFVYQSAAGVTITFKAKGEASELFRSVGKASGGALVEFSRQGAAVLSAPSCTVSRITNLRLLERQLRGIEDWDRRFVIVTKVVAADSATILVSNSSNSRVELRAAVRAQIGGADIADLSAGFRAVSSRGVGIEIVAQGGLTPLYLVQSFNRRFRDVIRGKGPTLRGSRKPVARRTSARTAPART